jgi:hypothetical protein
VRTTFALTETLHGFRVRGIARKVITAETFDGDDVAVAEKIYDFRQL